MLDWRELHPYIAVHAARIAQPLDVARGRGRPSTTTLSHAGLTALELDRARRRYAWHGGAVRHARWKSSPPAADWQATLAQAFERQLNAPFALDGRIDPFRFFAIDQGDAFFLGLAYDHFIAGGDSIIVLLNAIADRYAGIPPPAAPLSLYPRTHRRLFVRHPLAGSCAASRRLPAMAGELPPDGPAALPLARGRAQRVHVLHARARGVRAAARRREGLGRHAQRRADRAAAARAGCADADARPHASGVTSSPWRRS